MWIVLYDSKNRKELKTWDKCRNCHKILASNNIIVMSIKQSSVITICFKNLNWFPIHAEDDKKGKKSLFSPQDMCEKKYLRESHDWVSSICCDEKIKHFTKFPHEWMENNLIFEIEMEEKCSAW